MSGRLRVRTALDLLLVIVAALVVAGAAMGPSAQAQTAAPTRTPTARPTRTPTIGAATRTAGTATARAAATETARAAATAQSATEAATAVAAPVTTTAEVTPTLASPTAAPTEPPAAEAPAQAAQETLPTTRTVLLTGVLQLPPETPPASAPMARTITVVGEGRVTKAPDTVVTLMGVETISDTVRLAADENARIMTRVMEAIKGQGVAQEDIQTTGFTVYTERQPPAQEGGLERTLYHVSNNVSVRVRQLNNLSAILDAAISAGANAVHGVQFSIDDNGPLVAQARELAMADARAKAGALAGLAGVELGMVMQISEPAPEAAVPLAAAERGLGGGGGPISPGVLEVSDRVQVTYGIQ